MTITLRQHRAPLGGPRVAANPEFRLLARRASLIAAALLTFVNALATVCAQAPRVAQTPVADAPGSPVTAFNLHVVVTEEFLNRFIARQEVEPGPVQEQVRDVTIQGEQCTITSLHLDLLPSLDQAYGQLVLDGDVKSRTTGTTDKATIHSVGHSQFHAVKDLLFNGDAISTRHAQISVRSQNQNVGIQTRLDGTFLGPVANRMAARIVEQRKPQTEEMARQRVRDRVFPSFDGEVDKKLSNANDQLEAGLRGMLQKYDLLPAAQRVTTTDQHLHFAAAIGLSTSALPALDRKEGDELVIPGLRDDAPARASLVVPPLQIAPPKADLVSAHAISFYLHESAINGLLDRLKLKGWKTTDRELRAMSARLRSLRSTGDAGEEEPSRGPSMNLDTEIEFDRERPTWVEFSREQLTLRIRAALRPMGQAILPPVEIAVPFRLVERPTGWQLVAGEVDVQPQPGADGSGRLSDVAVKLIREAIANSLTEPQFPRELPIPSWPQDKPKLQLTAVRAADGWLAVSVD